MVTDLSASGSAVEGALTDVVKNLKQLIKIPIAVKLSPFFTALAHTASQLDRAGADGLVLFNRFYQPDIDISTMSVSPRVELSTRAELRPAVAGIAAGADGYAAMRS